MMPASACDCLRTDHRQMETCIDRLLAALRRAGPESVPEVEEAVRDIRVLTSIHFKKEEAIFYPSLRPAFPDLLAQMDRQHADVREVEQYIGELLSDPLPSLESHWLDELRLFGTQLHDFIQHHIIEEEDQLFRLAESRLTTEDQNRLAVAMREFDSRLSAP